MQSEGGREACEDWGMPKPIKKAAGRLPVPPKPKRSSDPMRAAQAILAEHMGRLKDGPSEPISFEEQYRAHMSKLGKIGGPRGGKARAENLSDKRLKEIAKKAAKARWGARERKQ